jgi:hypothetical protein
MSSPRGQTKPKAGIEDRRERKSHTTEALQNINVFNGSIRKRRDRPEQDQKNEAKI